MTIEELTGLLQGNHGTYQQHVSGVENQSTLQGMLAGEDFAYQPGGRVQGVLTGGAHLPEKMQLAQQQAMQLMNNSGLPKYQTIDGQRVYLNTGFQYTDGDYLVRPDPNAPVGSYSVAGQKRGGDGWQDVLGIAATVANPALGAVLNASQGGLDGGSGGLGSLLDVANQISNLGTDSGRGQTFADSQGNPGERPQLPPSPVENALEWLEGLLGNVDPNAIKIPIPGLPFPIPGSMTWEQLMEMAKKAGKPVWEILSDVVGGGDADEPAPTSGGQPPTSGGGAADDQADPGNWWDIGWDWGSYPTNPGDPDAPPASTPGTAAPGLPGATPQPPWDGEPQDQPEPPGGTPQPPGATPGNPDDGNGFTWPFLLPFPLPSQSKPKGKIDLWGDYQGPDQSYGYPTPDYGTPTNAPLFDWERQPGQPIQVAPDVQPRNEFLTPAEQALRRRQQLEGLLG